RQLARAAGDVEGAAAGRQAGGLRGQAPPASVATQREDGVGEVVAAGDAVEHLPHGRRVALTQARSNPRRSQLTGPPPNPPPTWGKCRRQDRARPWVAATPPVKAARRRPAPTVAHPPSDAPLSSRQMGASALGWATFEPADRCIRPRMSHSASAEIGAFALECAPFGPATGQTRSQIDAIPCPTPMHIVASP